MINKHKSNKIKENSNTVRHLNNGTDHRHSKSCCDQSSPARRTIMYGCPWHQRTFKLDLKSVTDGSCYCCSADLCEVTLTWRCRRCNQCNNLVRCHDMETLSVSLALCERNQPDACRFPRPVDSPYKGPVMRSFYVLWCDGENVIRICIRGQGPISVRNVH